MSRSKKKDLLNNLIYLYIYLILKQLALFFKYNERFKSKKEHNCYCHQRIYFLMYGAFNIITHINLSSL